MKRIWLFLVLLLGLACSGLQAEGIKGVSDETFEAEVLKSPLPVLVFFWPPWNGPCKRMATNLERHAGAYRGKIKFAKMNVDKNLYTSEKYKIAVIPTLLLFRDGGQVAQTTRKLHTKASLKAFLKKASMLQT